MSDSDVLQKEILHVIEPRVAPCPSCLLGTERGRQLGSAQCSDDARQGCKEGKVLLLWAAGKKTQLLCSSALLCVKQLGGCSGKIYSTRRWFRALGGPEMKPGFCRKRKECVQGFRK